MKIYTNYHHRQFIYYHDLSPKYKALADNDYDYLDEDSKHDQWIIYRDSLYHTSDFISLHNRFYTSQGMADSFPNYDGYFSDSFFSGVLIKLHEECYDCSDQCYSIATYIS